MTFKKIFFLIFLCSIINNSKSCDHIIEHVLIGDVSYTAGDFHCGRLRNIDTSPEHIYYEEDKEIISNVAMECDRVIVHNTKEKPYKFCGKVISHFDGDDSFFGSGTFVNHHHIITAAHNIYDKDKGVFAKRVQFISVSGDDAEVARIYVFKKWINEKQLCYDLALLVLNKSLVHDKEFAHIAHSRYPSQLLGEPFEIIGYSDNGKDLLTTASKISDRQCHRIFYKIDSSFGQSGGGILLNHKDHYCLIGIHTRDKEELDKGYFCSGIYLSEDMVSHIKNIISSTKRISNSQPQRSPYLHESSQELIFQPNAIEDIRTTFLLFKDLSSEKEHKKMALDLFKKSKTYKRTNAYQTEKLREQSSLNFKMHSRLLRIASLLYPDEYERFFEEEYERCKYSYENYEAFLSVDELSGKLYSQDEEISIRNLFSYNFNYISFLKDIRFDDLV